mgnify:CR=1 FL=1
MKTIDIRNPDGNVFCILGIARNFQDQLKLEKIVNKELDFVLSYFSNMEYDEILDKLEKSKLFKFVGREEA